MGDLIFLFCFHYFSGLFLGMGKGVEIGSPIPGFQLGGQKQIYIMVFGDVKSFARVSVGWPEMNI